MAKKEKTVKVQKTRVTLVGNVNVDDVVKALSVFNDLEVKVWNKRGRSASKKTVSVDEVSA